MAEEIKNAINPFEGSDLLATELENGGTEEFSSLILEPSVFKTSTEVKKVQDPISTTDTTKVVETVKKDIVPDSVITTFVDELKTRGLITLSDDEKIENPEQLFSKYEEALTAKAQARFEEALESLPEKDQLYFGLRKEGFSEDTAEQFTEKINYITSIDENKLKTDESIQEDLYARMLKEQNTFSTDTIKEMVQEAKDLNKLTSRATEAKTYLTNKYKSDFDTVRNEIEADKNNKIKVTNTFITDVKTSAEKLDKIGNFEIPQALRQKVLDSITKPAGKDKNGVVINSIQQNKMKNPVEFEKALHLYNAMGLFNIDDKGNFSPNLDFFTKTVETKVTKSMEEFFKQGETRTIGSPDTTGESETLSKFRPKQ